MKSQQQQQQERKQKAAYNVYSKVKPVVVKHILKDQIASLSDSKVCVKSSLSQYWQTASGASQIHQVQHISPTLLLLEPFVQHQLQNIQSRESVRFSETSFSPRFYGQGQPPYYGKPEEVSRDLIQSLEKGMSSLMRGQRTKITDRHFQTQGQLDGYELGSTSSLAFREDADGQEISMDELDKLKLANEDRIKSIEAKYFKKAEEFKKSKQVFKDNDERKEKHVDSSLSYPTYGRGFDPNPDINTYMINNNLCSDGSPKKKLSGEEQSISPSKKDKQKRSKIISPKRQQFETQFEKFMTRRYVEDKQKVQPPVDNGKFDCVTKIEGTLNVKVQQKLKEGQEQRLKEKLQKVKSLIQLENEVELALLEEATVTMGAQVVDKLKALFDSNKDQTESSTEVDFNDLIASLAGDEYFEGLMETVVREADGEKETLENLIDRMIKEHPSKTISWIHFLAFFSKRGRYQGFAQIQVSPKKRATLSKMQNEEQGQEEYEDKEEKAQQYLKDVKNKLVYKQDLVNKEGKGKYNVTLPQPYEFLKEGKRPVSIREQKLKQMLEEKVQKENEFRGFAFRANSIPKTTTQPLYQRIVAQKEARRQEVRRVSMALTKQNEKPFSFYERDQHKQRSMPPELPECMRHPPFRANIIPHKILVPLYKRMVDNYEYEREQRIKKNAEISYSLAKLPPRMEEYEKQRKLQIENGTFKTRSHSVDKLCTFQPPRAKPVPDFKRLQKQFQHTLEAQRQSHTGTTPVPFVFHQPKSTANLRGYLDIQNQQINPTKKKQRKVLKSLSPGTRESKENPASTLKFTSYVNKRRQEMETKKHSEEVKFQEEVERFIKQNRMQQRVRCSPAIVNNAIELKKRKTMSLGRAKESMKRLERNWEEQKAQIEFNVANKPLLVEQVSKAFIHNLNQIRELQRYVNILREANLDPDEHLTDEQKELLLSAEYYDRLNAATAYFPSQMEQPEDMENEGEEVYEGQCDEGEEDQEDQYQEGDQQNYNEPIQENIQEEEEEEEEEEQEQEQEQEQEGYSQGQGEDENEDGENQEGEEEEEEDEGEQDNDQQYTEREEGADDDDMIELDEEQLKQLLMHQQQMLMAQEMDGDYNMDDIQDEDFEEDQNQQDE